MNSVAATQPAMSTTRPLQFTSGGHVVGFTPKEVMIATGGHVLRVEFVGSEGVVPAAASPSASDAKATPLTRVTYPGIWGGITLAYDATGGLLSSTYTVAAGADPAKIKLRYNLPVNVGPGGELQVAFVAGAMRESAPVAWQDIEGFKVPVPVAFRKESEREVGFALGPYDKTRPLTIDPTLTWNTFLGGTAGDYSTGVAVDAASGAIYVTGTSAGAWGTPIRAWSGGSDAFVAKLDVDGTLLWNTFLGTTGSDDGFGIAVDAGGSVFVTGSSSTTWGIPLRSFAGYYDAFVAKLDSNGALLWNTFLGGTGLDGGISIGVDTGGNVYVTGLNYAPWGSPVRPWAGSELTLVAKLDTNGALLWNTFLGGTSGANGIAVDTGGNAYVTGYTGVSWGNPIRAYAGGTSDAFAAKVDTNGALQWNTFLGGPGTDYGEGIAVDASGSVSITGHSFSPWGDPIRAPAAGNNDAFVARLDTNGALLWNTFLGGPGTDYGSSVAVDAASGSVYVTGTSLATWGDPIRAFAGTEAVLVAKLDSDGALQGNTFLGGTATNGGRGIAVDASSNVYVAGSCSTTWGDPIRAFTGNIHQAFVARLATVAASAPVALDQALSTPEDTARAITLTATYVGGDTLTYSVETSPEHGTLSGTPPALAYHPPANYSGTDSFTFKANDGATDSNIATVTITVASVNDAPGFASGGGQAVPEDAGAQTVNGWATEISAGPADEAGQTLNFNVTNDNNGLFAAQPAVTDTGTLTYSPAVDANGTATVTVQLHDDGGTANGGHDTSVAQTFTITIGSVSPPRSLAVPAWDIFFGGPHSYGDDGRGVAVDAGGNVYIIGSSYGTWGDPILPASDNMYARDTFVAKFNANGNLLWNTFLGATITDSVSSIAVDANGNVCVTGLSESAWGDPIRPFAEYSDTSFVAKLDTNGALLWSSFKGMGGGGIAVDSTGNVYVTGGQTIAGMSDILVTRFDTDGALQWSTLHGGVGHDFGRDIAVDASGSVYVSGLSYSTWGVPIRPWTGGLYDVFAAKFDASGALLWNSFLGAECFSTGVTPGYSASGFAVDAGGNVYVSGMSWRTWGDPIRPAAGERDAFVAKLDTNGGLLWNTFLGAADVADSASALAVDTSGNVYVTGGSRAAWGAPLHPWAGDCDVLVAKLDTNGGLLWNAFLGNAENDFGNGIAVDAGGNIYVTGFNHYGFFAPTHPEQPDVFLSKIGYGTNTAPVASDQVLSTFENTAKTITLSATYADPDTLTYSVITPPAHGTLGGEAPDLTYTPAADFVGSDSFTFKASDGSLDSNSATVSITVAADTTRPTGSIIVNNGAASTGGTAVTLNLSASDHGGSGVASMRFRDNTMGPYSSWEAYTTTKSWTLPSGLGTKKVYAQFIDSAGNISDANPAATGTQGYVDAIELIDNTAPTGSIRINNNAASTSTTAVTLNLSASDAGGSGIGSMRFRNNATDPYSAWEPYQRTKAWTLTSGAGTKKVYVLFKDVAGNISDANPVVTGTQPYQDAIQYTGL